MSEEISLAKEIGEALDGIGRFERGLGSSSRGKLGDRSESGSEQHESEQTKREEGGRDAD